MNKRTVAAVCFSRANYARMKSILKAIHEHPELELKVILGASAILSRFGNVAQLIEKQILYKLVISLQQLKGIN